MQAYIYCAKGNDPYENLAIEDFFTEYVSKHVEEPHAIIYFWQNEDSVIFGRNQNAANECNLSLLQRWNVHPVRRKTGGGAVFHDIKNLNFSFITSKSLYDKEKSMCIVSHALSQLGIPAQVNGRNDIVLGDAKISGNAYSSNETMTLHHGTLLLSVDIDKLERLLTVDQSKLASKGIHSVRSRVQNLQEQYPSLQIEDYKNAIQQQFCKCYDISQLQPFAFESKHRISIQEKAKQYASLEWIFGHDLSGLTSETKRFSWGSCTITHFGQDDADGYIDIYSDTLYSEEFEHIRRFIRSRMSVRQATTYSEDVNVGLSETEQLMLQDVWTLL